MVYTNQVACTRNLSLKKLSLAMSLRPRKELLHLLFVLVNHCKIKISSSLFAQTFVSYFGQYRSSVCHSDADHWRVRLHAYFPVMTTNSFETFMQFNEFFLTLLSNVTKIATINWISFSCFPLTYQDIEENDKRIDYIYFISFPIFSWIWALWSVTR